MVARTTVILSSVISCTVYLCIWLQCLPYITASKMKVCTLDSKPSPQGICGKKIDEALSLICGKGGYIEKFTAKRSDSLASGIDAKSFLDMAKQSAQSNELHPSLSDILVDREAATSFLDKRASYFQSGVACECCYHSCSIKELSYYCKDPIKAMLQFGK